MNGRHVTAGNNGTRGAWILIAVAAFAVGCGPSNPYKTVSVKGKVTYADGSAIQAERIVVTFVPQVQPIDKKQRPHQGTAEVNVSDGTFTEATTWKYGDGVIPGEEKVLIVALDKEGQPTSAVPGSYADVNQTPLKITVQGGEAIELKVDKAAK